MVLIARLKKGETLGDRVMKVDHAGEHGAVCVYRAQRWFAQWRAPEMVSELDEFLPHERNHRRQFEAELHRRNKPRCSSYFLCAAGGFFLGSLTGLAGRQAIAATTVAIERVVLRHMNEQIQALNDVDLRAVHTLRKIIGEEQEHHDRSVAQIDRKWPWSTLIEPLVAFSTKTIIWLGMRI